MVPRDYITKAILNTIPQTVTVNPNGDEMKVYITYEEDGYNGDQVEKVFSDESIAQNYIIATRFVANSFYADMKKHKLEEFALKYIEEHDVI